MPTNEEILGGIAANLEKGFNDKKRTTGFVLLTFPLGQDWSAVHKPVVNFVGNSSPEDIHAAVKNLMESFGYHCFLKVTDINKMT